MARGIRGARSDQRTAPPPTEQDIGDALRTVFGSREEVAEFFGELEAKMVAEMGRICAEAKRVRDAEWPLPPEDVAHDRPAQPMVTMSQHPSDVSVDETAN